MLPQHLFSRIMTLVITLVYATFVDSIETVWVGKIMQPHDKSTKVISGAADKDATQLEKDEELRPFQHGDQAASFCLIRNT